METHLKNKSRFNKYNFVIYYHFNEIRIRFLYLLVSFFFTFLVSYCYYSEIFYLIVRPLLLYHDSFIFTELTEALYTTINSCFFITIFLILPFILYQFWCFLIPSSFKSERNQIAYYIIFSFCFFILGIFILYFLILPEIYYFLIHFEIKTNSLTVQLQARIQPYVHLVCDFLVFFSVIFQIPIFCFFFFQLKVLTAKNLFDNRSFMYFFCVILAAFLSPPDVISQLAIVACLLCGFEFLIWLGLFHFETTLKN